jgi:two-component system NtrC family sensor kinase
MDAIPNAPRKQHVLIVDDDVELARFFAELLKLHGYETSVEADATLALKHALLQETDAVICDLHMPALDGDLFYATIERTNPQLARRFIFVTGLADEERFRKFINTVEAPVLRKPVPMDLLVNHVNRLTGRR